MKSLAERRKICNRLGDRYYPPAERRDLRMRATIERLLPPGGNFLDAGSGPWLGLARFCAGRAGLSIGMDLEPLHPGDHTRGALGVRGDLQATPFQPGSFDLIAMRSVLEHVADPERVFSGLAAILRPGGSIVALTPSRWYYASVVGRLLPDAAAARLLGFIFGPTVYDNFPTWYRANTPSSLARIARGAGLELVEATACPHPPDYLKFSPVLFRIGVAFDRFAGLLPAARVLQASFLYVLRKP